MKIDMWFLYRQMFRSRVFEEAVAELWKGGRIFGEMHLGMGEEAVAAGVVDHLRDGDAMALDHRGTPPLLMRGVEPVRLLLEFLGHPQGLCKGQGGHMHLFSPPHLAASSGIVGASGPAAAGFGLAARHLRPGTVAVAFFGEGALNQGMLMEAMNLASAWKLPVLFVCKDNGWAITTPSASVSAGKPVERAGGLGMEARQVDGLDTGAVWAVAREAVERARKGKGPTFIHAVCTHLEGHFLGDPLVEMARHPVSGMKQYVGPLFKSLTRARGAAIGKRADGLGTVISLIGKTAREKFSKQRDPIKVHRKRLESDQSRLQTLEAEVRREIRQAVDKALERVETKEEAT